MSVLKGFGQIGMLIDNDDDVVAVIGEMSMDSKTFARDHTVHTHVDYPGVAYIGMMSLGDDLLPAQPTSTQANNCLELITWVHARARAGQIGPSQAAFTTLFSDAFSGRFTLLASGSHLTSGIYYYPGSITVAPTGREDEDNWTIWFADERFQNEYDTTILYVVPPIPSIDQFFNPYSVVLNLVENTSREWVIDEVNAIRGKSPYTYLRMPAFNWVDPVDPDRQIQTFWTLIIYGKAGDNMDRYKEAIIAYVEANSTHGIPEWAEIFPDIFRSTEMIAVPTYYQHAIPDSGQTTGLYSPVVNRVDSGRLMTYLGKGPGYTEPYALQATDVISALYRSLGVVLLTGPENRSGFETFKTIYWDYLNATTTSNDGQRMRPKTRAFVMLLNDMLEKAEKLTPTSVVPPNFNRVERDGVWYLSRTIDDLMVLVVSKHSVLQAAADLNIPIN